MLCVIAQVLRDLNEDELHVVLLVAQGLKDGKEVYGDLELSRENRDMASEGVQELRDCLVYTSAAILKLLGRS